MTGFNDPDLERIYRAATTAQTIAVRHNIEVAHRLSQLPGKCENIHGHSMWVRLELAGDVDERGLLGGLDFGAVKRGFRGLLDTEFDHRLLLNVADPIADLRLDDVLDLPGLRRCPGDPTTENLARWIGEVYGDAALAGVDGIRVTVDETHVNSASWASGVLA